MKHKFIVLTIVIILLVSFIVGATVAYFIAVSGEVENTFTIGNVEIALTETTGTSYPMTPGTNLEKDPTVTVKAGSDACWLFIKIDKSAEFDSFMSFRLADGWTSLDGEDGIYYRAVSNSNANMSFSVLYNDHVRVLDSVTEEQLGALKANPTLSFTAYAIQQTGFSTASLAWNELKG